jgi:hypothetical protein
VAVVSRTRHDRLDKESLLHWLERLGIVRLNHPIAGEVLFVDVCFEQTRLLPAYRKNSASSVASSGLASCSRASVTRPPTAN